jgi:DNA polymerase I-like protein with 3'-5' exonuclease and polymerase domains
MLQRIFLSKDEAHLEFLRQDILKNHLDTPITCLLATPVMLAGFREWLRKQPEISLDIETTHFDPYMGRIVLTTVYAGDKVITFDNDTVDVLDMFCSADLAKSVIVGHNLKFETLWFLKHGVEFKQVFCTMLAEQKLLQGADVKHDLVSALLRRSIPLPDAMDKSIREEFTNGVYKKPLVKHILYNQADTLQLLQLKKQQQVLIEGSNMTFLLNQIHFPLIRVLSLAEMEGMVINEPKFLDLAAVAEKAMQAIGLQMETWIHEKYPAIRMEDYNKPVVTQLEALELRKEKLKQRIVKTQTLVEMLEGNSKTHLKSYRLAKSLLERTADVAVEINNKIQELNKISAVSWTAGKQVISLLVALGCNPLPKAKDKKTKTFKPSLAKAARERWLLQQPNNPLHPLIVLYDSYMKQTKHVNSFGKSFLDKYRHPHTGKFHTLYKQGTVETGRLASGNSDQTPAKFNSQQLPPVIRDCFETDPGYLIITCDLTGAELITMCSLAQDHRLLELSRTTDLHSYFANKGWEAIYKSRGKQWTEADVIVPNGQNAKKRKAYKPMLFGTVYGLRPPKAAETLNVSEKEGGIALQTIVKEIPATIKMVEAASKFAIKHGYIIHNERTNSRRWFSAVLHAKQTGDEIPFMDRIEVESAARNTRIQGTQADMLCEAMVLLQRFIDFYKLDAKILMQVHDELVVKCHPDYKDWFPQRVKEIMVRTANKYLVGGVHMEADCKIGSTWCK